ncbi:MAG TPA: hypothetical protein ENH64_08365 [Pseudomonas xinjiangensis]|uniref:Holin-X, holin superfamily III n=1 Tax=Halopseudomonas xinjiangensis TaxID=487184 RepID=A0A7V1FRY4_9GAMM|nr:hypothetical protein [Halopseudomonas xinjiangensis]
MDWAKNAGATAGDLIKLMFLELKLAMSDTRRIVVLGLAMVPLALLAWIGLSVLLAWWAYVPSESVTLALCVFLAVQVVPIIIMLSMIKKYSKSLSLPSTKKQMAAFKEGFQSGSETADQ